MDYPREITQAMNTALKTNYLNTNYQYLKNTQIVEWDIKSAGLSVLKFRKLLPEKELGELSKMDKTTRTIKEGLLQKAHPKIAEEIITTLSKVRQAFILLNNIRDTEILAIKKDAIFLINHRPEVKTIKEAFEFREKGTYTSYILLGKKEFYYSSYLDTLDIKGLSKETIEKCKDYFLKDIKGFLRNGERITQDVLFTLFRNYREKYLSRKLPLETYRELDSGMFRVGDYLVENISQEMLRDVDISQNYMNYFLPLIQTML